MSPCVCCVLLDLPLSSETTVLDCLGKPDSVANMELLQRVAQRQLKVISFNGGSTVRLADVH